MKVALLGGSFDPPHLAHQQACRVLLEREGFAQVWMIPCFRHAFGKTLAAYEQRVQMCRLCALPFGSKVEVSQIEAHLPSQAGNRTIDTVVALRQAFLQHDFTWVVGSDVLPELPRWREVDRLLGLVRLLVLRRPGFEAGDTRFAVTADVLPEISSTEVRRRTAAGEPIDELVPAAVGMHIRKHQLYGAS